MVRRVPAENSNSQNVKPVIVSKFFWLIWILFIGMSLSACSGAFWDEYSVNPAGGGFSQQ